jgi:hypothetical protein
MINGIAHSCGTAAHGTAAAISGSRPNAQRVAGVADAGVRTAA